MFSSEWINNFVTFALAGLCFVAAGFAAYYHWKTDDGDASNSSDSR